MRGFIVCAAIVFSLLPLCAGAQSVTGLLQKHRAYAGWSSAGDGVPSWKATGTRTHGGAVDTFTEARRGMLFHDTVSTRQGLTDETGFSGRYVWHGDANHFWSVQLGRAAQAAIAWDIVVDEAAATFEPSLQGTANIDGTSAAILRIQPKGLVPIDLYEDPASGAFIRVVVAPESPQSRTFDNITYAVLPDGKRIVNGWRDGDLRYNIERIDRNAAISDADLQISPKTASWTYGSAPLEVATVSDNAHYVRIGASVNGRSGVFLLSTATPSIILFDNFARAAGVQDLGTSDFSPYLGNSMFAGYSRVSTLQAGSAVLHNVVVQRIVSPNTQLAGVLGYDFFADAIVGIDLVHQRMNVQDPLKNAAVPGDNGYAFPLDLTNFTPDIALALPHGEAHPTIDTGLGGFMILSQTLRDRGMIAGHDVSSEASVGFGGWGATGDPIAKTGLRITYTSWNNTTTSGVCMETDALTVGPYTYQNPSVCLGGSNVFGNDGGLIGLDFLRHFNWIVDYPHAQFVVTPNGQ